MNGRTTFRTIVTLVVTLAVATLTFTGGAAAQSLIDIDSDLDGDASQSGGSGSGSLEVVTDAAELGGGGAVEGDVEEQEVVIALEGEGGPAGETTAVSLECTISPDAAESLTDACEAAPVGPPNPELLLDNPESQVALVETLAVAVIENPEAAPSLLALLGVPTDQIPTDQIPWDSIPNDQIPTEDIPSLSEQIPWDSIPTDQIPTDQLPL